MQVVPLNTVTLLAVDAVQCISRQDYQTGTRGRKA